ncbi:MAG: class I SAM-dependent methyltransferase [Chitinophagaceae bacterium]|nr:class I SAM-dependent methyltransferase [Chitinophagaceae bacterium]
MDNTQRFGNRVDNYVKYRPGYPKEVLRFLSETKRFNPDWKVADIGSGTGISTALFLDNGNTVYAVEPNDPMRQKAEDLLDSNPAFISVSGTAENTTLQSASIDLIVAGQAFHWFNPTAAKKEFTRILRPGGAIALMWNERQKYSDFEKAYEDLLQTYGTDYKDVNHSNITEKEIGAFFQPAPFQFRMTDHRQTFDWERLKGRLLSSSYIPLEPSDIYEKMIKRLKEIFDSHQQGGVVYFNYQTKVYIA